MHLAAHCMASESRLLIVNFAALAPGLLQAGIS